MKFTCEYDMATDSTRFIVEVTAFDRKRMEFTQEERELIEQAELSTRISDKFYGFATMAEALERKSGLLDGFVNMSEAPLGGRLSEADLKRWMDDLYGGPKTPMTATGAMLAAEAKARR